MLKRFLAVCTLTIMFLSNSYVYGSSDIYVGVPYENNLVEHHNGIIWNCTPNFDLGDTSELTDEEYNKLLNEVISSSVDEPKGESDKYDFKYYRDILTDYALQYVQIDSTLYIVSWEGDNVVGIESWEVSVDE